MPIGRRFLVLHELRFSYHFPIPQGQQDQMTGPEPAIQICGTGLDVHPRAAVEPALVGREIVKGDGLPHPTPSPDLDVATVEGGDRRSVLRRCGPNGQSGHRPPRKGFAAALRAAAKSLYCTGRIRRYISTVCAATRAWV
ncbi:MAG: hypothetical protein RMK65_07815 [Anaerolineae bacterium]|nr:hypothetical protein [Anaerolineae bacterium]